MLRIGAVALLCLAGCELGEVPEEDGDYLAFDGSDLFRRVVLGRVYQKADWTLPHAGATAAERVAYACSVIVPLRPSYVSGLVRLDDDSLLTADQIAVFTGIRQCVKAANPRAKLDVVLNAEHYTDDARHESGLAALAALKQRAAEVQQVLGAEIIFFDFFSSPYNDSPAHAGWYEDALTRGTEYIRDTLGMRVGGNVWGLEVPPNADFVALDNFDRQDPFVEGFVFNQRQLDAFGDRVPVLIHIENNPQKPDSKGLRWIEATRERRKETLDKFASQQRELGYSYMFPVFFPLQCCVGTTCGPAQCEVQPSDRRAYDAALDGNMLAKIAEGLAK